MTTIINLTPHTIHCGTTAIPPSGTIARAASTVTPCGSLAGIPIGIETFGAPVDLPPAEPGLWPATMYVVSTITAAAARSSGRSVDDLLVPGAPIRDAEGRVIGCAALMMQGAATMVSCSDEALRDLGLTADEIERIPHGGCPIVRTALYSFGGGGGGPGGLQQLDAMTARGPVRLALVGQADRYGEAARRGARVLEIGADGGGWSRPDAAGLQVLLRALASVSGEAEQEIACMLASRVRALL